MSEAISETSISLSSGDDKPPDQFSSEFHIVNEPHTMDASVEEGTTTSSSVKILVTGRAGSGKTTLVSGIIGEELSEGTGGIISEWHRQLDNVEVTVWDTPGLLDGTKAQIQQGYLDNMKQKCSERHLTMYCIKISETRFVHTANNPDVVAMRKLTTTFGKEFWKSCVIVLTFANVLPSFNMDWDDLPQSQRDTWFLDKITEWKGQVRNVLFHDIRLSNEDVQNIKIVPAGYYTRPHLPGIKYWFSELWHVCTDAISSEPAREALKRVNKNRIKTLGQVKVEDFNKPIQQQPIVEIPHPSLIEIAGGGVAGALAGGTIGLVGLVAGPPAVAVSIPVGALVGMGVGLGGIATGWIPIDKVKGYLPSSMRL